MAFSMALLSSSTFLFCCAIASAMLSAFVSTSSAFKNKRQFFNEFRWLVVTEISFHYFSQKTTER